MLDNALFEYQAQLLRRTPTDVHRYLYDQIAWDARMVGITGPRGVGKSTTAIH